MEAISELVQTLLARRGIVAEPDIEAFLNPDYLAHTHDPFLLNGMDVAVDRLLHAITENERIAVYADFDCDGIPGAALLSDFFNKIGYQNFEVYLPHRDREGYGFHIDAIDQLASPRHGGVKLIITVDVGTVAFDAAAHAKSIGVDVIITDHHEPLEKLPDALAVLNPKIVPPDSSGVERYPFPHLCGAAMAFKLVQATLIEGKKRNLEKFSAVPDGWEKWLLDLVAIATVADMVSLTGENRALAHWGIAVLRKSPRPGITALCNATRIRKSEITEGDIGFSIAPRINAASRMDEPDLALKLLTTHDSSEAEQLAAQLEKLNTRRKGVVAGVVKEAKKRTRERFTTESIVVLGNPEWKPALLGLAANSIMNDRGGIVCLWGRDAMGKLKGSCRSDGSLSITDLFANAGDIFEECGGHAASGGFSVSHERVHDLQKTLAGAAAALAAAAPAPSLVEGLSYDALLTLPEISWALYKDVSRLAPYGAENPKPLFLISGATIASVRAFGKENNHIEITLSDERGFELVRAFDFFRSAESFTHAPVSGQKANILATLERDSFRGPARLALRIVDIVSAD